LKQSEAYTIAVASLSSSREVRELLGEPIATGIPVGSIEINGSEGKAELSFSVTGSHGHGTAHVVAIKEMGQWHIDRGVLNDEVSGQRLELQ
jgi:hypothetical protein